MGFQGAGNSEPAHHCWGAVRFCQGLPLSPVRTWAGWFSVEGHPGHCEVALAPLVSSARLLPPVVITALSQTLPSVPWGAWSPPGESLSLNI